MSSCRNGKRRFATEARALAELARIMVDNLNGKRRRTDHVECAVYQCPMCGGGWHLTSQPRTGELIARL